jgi:hypothetical protein
MDSPTLSRMHGEVQENVGEVTVSEVDFFEACCGGDPTVASPLTT